MANLDLMEQYLSPIYISSSNMVIPIAINYIDKFDDIYTKSLIFFNYFTNILYIAVQTFTFIANQALSESIKIIQSLNADKIIFIISIYTIFMVLVLDVNIKKINKQKEQIEILEKNIKSIEKQISFHTPEKQETFQDEVNTNLRDINEYKSDINLINTRLNSIEKKNKKLEKEMKKYY